MLFQQDDDLPEPPQLRRLRWLVTGLMVVLIVGMLAIVATIVIRLGFGLGGGLEGAGPISADRFALPPQTEVVAVGRGGGTVLFVLRRADGSEVLRAYDAETGAPAGASAITRDETGD